MSKVVQRFVKILRIGAQTSLNNAVGIQLHRAFVTSAQNKFILTSSVPEIQIPNTSIPEFVFSHSEQFSDLIAFECSVSGRKYTFANVRKKSFNFARSLRNKLHLAAGDVVALLLPNIPEFPIAILGALEAGCIVTTINPQYNEHEILKQIEDCQARIIITLASLHPNVNKCKTMLSKQINVLIVKVKDNESLPDGVIDFAELATNSNIPFGYEIASTDTQNVALLPYSSGTTGLPKGVQLTHRNVVANLCQTLVDEVLFVQKATKYHQDATPLVLPMFHIFGLVPCCLLGMLLGCRHITVPKFTPESYISVLEQNVVHFLALVPPLVLFLANNEKINPSHLSSIRNVVSGAAPLGIKDEQKLLKKLPRDAHIQQGYGLTETSPTITLTPRSLYHKASGSVGQPLANTQVKIAFIDDDCEHITPLAPYEQGELLVKGPQTMLGYLNRPESTKEVFLGDGWFRTGDIAHYDKHGLIFITDRLKELIKVNGFQVAPAELEELIRSHPDVRDVAVIGVPHKERGEVPRAYIVPNNKKSFDEHAIHNFVNDNVANYKRLRGGIEILEEVPRSASGKILRRQLKVQYTV